MEPLDLTFEAGETYYLQLNLKTRAFDSQVVFKKSLRAVLTE